MAGDGTLSRYSSLLFNGNEIHLFFLYCQPVNNSAFFFCFSFPRCLSFGNISVKEETVGLNPYMGTKNVLLKVTSIFGIVWQYICKRKHVKCWPLSYIHFCTNGVSKDASLSISYSFLCKRMCIDEITSFLSDFVLYWKLQAFHVSHNIFYFHFCIIKLRKLVFYRLDWENGVFWFVSWGWKYIVLNQL